MTIVLFLLAVSAAGLGGYALLTRLGLDDFESWAGGRVAGLVMVALPAWWLGVVGLRQWRRSGPSRWFSSQRPGCIHCGGARAGGGLVTAELIFLVAAALVIFIRLDHPNISRQEKPMDLGIFATLLRCEAFPPPDMWLSGETLPYYYWGAAHVDGPAVLQRPAPGTRLQPDGGSGGRNDGGAPVGGGSTDRGSHRSGLLVAFFGLFAGTPDAVRQLFEGPAFANLDLWHSSRQIVDTITEFPLFTFWHGDLHPHLLSMPVALPRPAGRARSWPTRSPVGRTQQLSPFSSESAGPPTRGRCRRRW